jgi:hypothetical protein
MRARLRPSTDCPLIDRADLLGCDGPGKPTAQQIESALLRGLQLVSVFDQHLQPGIHLISSRLIVFIKQRPAVFGRQSIEMQPGSDPIYRRAENSGKAETDVPIAAAPLA